MKPKGERQYHRHQAIILALLILLVVSLMAVVQVSLRRNLAKPVDFGMTYSTKYAYELGFDTHKGFIAMMDELGAKRFRLPIYWSDIEKSRDVYDWGEVRWMADEAAKRGAKVTFAIGMRVPRYPECFIPDWAYALTPEEFDRELLEYVQKGIRELDGYPSVQRWQIENEPSFAYFGECSAPNPARFEAEIAAARSVTRKPIVTTSSGEFGNWIEDAKLVDTLGVSLYRGADLAKIGYFAYPIEPWFYTLRHFFTFGLVKDVLISELQVEPWLTKPLTQVGVEEQVKKMPVSRIEDDIAFAKKTGFREIWVWGAEWWYYLKQKQGITTYWEFGKRLFRSH